MAVRNSVPVQEQEADPTPEHIHMVTEVLAAGGSHDLAERCA